MFGFAAGDTTLGIVLGSLLGAALGRLWHDLDGRKG
jgi:hypothetical protein